MKFQKKHLPFLVAAAILGAGFLLPSPDGSEAAAFHPRQPDAGEPLRGLSPTLAALFNTGQDVFLHEFNASEGLGPLYNERACQTCHGGLGGRPGGPDPNGVGSEFNVTHFGLDQGGLFNPLRNFGGPVIQRRTIRDTDAPSCPIMAESVPAFANVTSTRHTPAVWGFGLLDAIPDDRILARQNLGRDGIIGFANWGVELQAVGATGTLAQPPRPLRGASRVGRFGWKAQTATLEQFSADPFNIELGITNLFFPQEFTPTGLADPGTLPAGCDPSGPTPDDITQEDSVALYHFQALLAPPPRLRPTRRSIAGRILFRAIGCADCHVPRMRTSREYHMELADGTTVRVPELENEWVRAYTDLLVHDMGPGLADNDGATIGRTMGRARGNHWRTTPLWGARFKNAYLHDGRTADLREAILWHGGEAQRSRDRFDRLPRRAQDNIVEFINRL